MDKRGQIFLIAAIIIVGALVSVTGVFNAAKSSPNNNAFDGLTKEVRFETKRVLDHGTYYKENTDMLMKGFLEEYAGYIAEEKVLFLVGNETGLYALYFEKNSLSGSVNIVTGQTTIVPIQVLKQEEAKVKADENGMISVIINGAEYKFKLLEGQNFFFVIGKEDDNGNAYFSAG